jgi:outer membrane receptor protein involved in Fe transport
MDRRLGTALVGCLLLGAPCTVQGQVGYVLVAERGPRFLSAEAPADQPVDASSAAPLRRRVHLALSAVTLDEALQALIAQTGLEMTYSGRVVPLARRVSLHARDITVAAALTEVLLDAGVDVAITSTGQLSLVPRRTPPAASARADSAVVEGQVTDQVSGAAILGATVSLVGEERGTVTSALGRYRLTGLAAGTYTIQVRFIGYTPSERVVSVGGTAGSPTVANFTLVRAVPQMAQLVVTGTVIPTEQRALPTPITVVSGEDIRAQHLTRIDQLFRGTVPGSVAWDLGAMNYFSSINTRGATSFGDNTIKTYIDGVEVADPLYIANVDPTSVDRIEVIRGPQASTVYGSGAIGGVMQIFTRRGDGELTRPKVEASAAIGGIQSEQRDGLGARQDYSLSLRGGGRTGGYYLGGSYRDVGAWLPSYYSRDGGFNGGVHFMAGDLSVAGSARYAVKRLSDLYAPALTRAGYAYFAVPSYLTDRVQQQTYSIQVTHATRSWWRQQLTIGYDQSLFEQYNTQPRFTTPSDSLLTVGSTDATKLSLAYNTSVAGRLGTSVTSNLTVGADHYAFLGTSTATTTASRTSGTIDGQSFAVSRLPYKDTGLFAQMQVGLFEQLFITAGVRGEWNDNFGDAYGTDVSPRLGATWSRPLGPMTAKVRGSYGEAIRAPTADQKVASVSPFSTQLANPLLGPERQTGWDGGLDVYFGSTASLGLTYYDQTVEDLIDAVTDPAASTYTLQWQNVGRIKNTGWEFEGQLALGLVRVGGTFSITNSTVRTLAPTYGGAYTTGDRVNGVSRYSGGMSVSVTPTPRTTLTGGLTYVGAWTSTDAIALFGVFFDGQPFRGSARDYWIRYPGFTKINVGVTQILLPQLSVFARVENVVNVHALERDNLTTPMGRVSVLGARLHY